MKKLLLGFMFICACATTYAYPKNINITKSEGAYIRANFSTLFGKNQICQSIGRTYVNFPAIYDNKRPDLDKALLNLIKRGDRNYTSQGYDTASGEALDYFYGYMIAFEDEG